MVKKELIENLLTSSPISTITMSRITYRGSRMYVSKDPFKIYSGLTGALSCASFKGNEDVKRIDKWRDSMISHLGSIEAQEAYLNSMADFGTLVHECVLRIWEQKFLDWKQEQNFARSYFENSARKNGIMLNENVVDKQVFAYCKHAASLMQFFHDNVIDVYGIESMCKSDSLCIATPVDIVCKIKDGRNITLNIKTSSQISDHQREQVAMEMLLWNETYDKCFVDATGIIRPKDWRIDKVPTYELEILKPEEQKELAKNATNRLLLARDDSKSTYVNFPTSIHVFSGQTKLGDKPNIECLTLEQFLNENFTSEILNNI